MFDFSEDQALKFEASRPDTHQGKSDSTKATAPTGTIKAASTIA
jgi:hypothetical protein